MFDDEGELTSRFTRWMENAFPKANFQQIPFIAESLSEIILVTFLPSRQLTVNFLFHLASNESQKILNFHKTNLYKNDVTFASGIVQSSRSDLKL